MSDDSLRDLGRAARARDDERERWLADPANADLVAPPSAAEQARVLRAVLPPAREAAAPAWRWAFAGGLALAAAAVVAVLVPRAPDTLPAFALEVPSMGYSSLRGPEPSSPVLRLTPGMALEVVLRPSAAWEQPVAARALIEQGGAARDLAWTAELAGSGAARFRGELGRDVVLPPGRSRLGFVIGDPARVAAPRPVEDGHVRVLWLDVDVAP